MKEKRFAENQLSEERVMSRGEAYKIFEKHYRALRVPFPHLLKITIEKYGTWRELPELEYPVPILPELEHNHDNRIWLGAMLDAEGSVIQTYRRYDKVDKIYRYEYLYPCVEFYHTNKGVAEKFGRLTDEEYWIEERLSPLKPYYRYIALGIKSMTILHYAKPHLIVHRDSADKIFKQYRKWFSIRLR